MIRVVRTSAKGDGGGDLLMIQRQDVIRVVLEHNLVELLSLVSVLQVELMN